jgi:hypothetical protein
MNRPTPTRRPQGRRDRAAALRAIASLTQRVLDAADGPIEQLAELVADRGRRLAELETAPTPSDDERAALTNIVELDVKLQHACARRRDELGLQMRRLGRQAAPAFRSSGGGGRLVSESA